MELKLNKCNQKSHYARDQKIHPFSDNFLKPTFVVLSQKNEEKTNLSVLDTLRSVKPLDLNT